MLKMPQSKLKTLHKSWVVGYGRLSATDKRVPDGDAVFEIGSITFTFQYLISRLHSTGMTAAR